MRVVYLDQYVVPPGRLLDFAPAPDADEPTPSEVPASFNQGNHVNGAATKGTWLAVAFEVAGPVDREALAETFLALIRRHGTLSTSFVKSPAGVVRLQHGPVCDLEVTELALADDVASRRAQLNDALDEACRPTAYPAYLLAAIEPSDPADPVTVICGFDHVHTDAYSLALVLRDITILYAGFSQGHDATRELPEVGSHLAQCQAEAQDTASPDDPRIRAWHAFLDGDHGGLPQFPLDLGVPIGARAPQQVDVATLLDDESTGALERAAQGLGAGVFAACFAACVQATAALGESAALNPATPYQTGDALRALIPVHTRREPQFRDAVGWFVTNGPVEVSASAEFPDTVRAAATQIRHALDLSQLSLREAVGGYAGGLRHPRSSVFMVSYIDYRSLPGHSEHQQRNAHHISASSDCDDLQIWFSRTDEGLAIRLRYPGTEQAKALMGAWIDQVRSALHSL